MSPYDLGVSQNKNTLIMAYYLNYSHNDRKSTLPIVESADMGHHAYA